LQHDGKILLVHNVYKQQWELPGGIIEAGESAGEAALRELFEESCQRPLEMWFRGLICYAKGPQAEAEYGVLYCGRPSQLFPFKPNHEVDQIYWWTPGEPLDGLNPIDAALATAFGPESQ
jgi:8-oxo-dGTP diphosphatase